MICNQVLLELLKLLLIQIIFDLIFSSIICLIIYPNLLKRSFFFWSRALNLRKELFFNSFCCFWVLYLTFFLWFSPLFLQLFDIFWRSSSEYTSFCCLVGFLCSILYYSICGIIWILWSDLQVIFSVRSYLI